MNRIEAIDCAAAREALSARGDGELDDDRELARHLSRCERCRAHAAALDDLAQRWRTAAPSLRRARTPDDLWSRIEARAHPQSRSHSRRAVSRARWSRLAAASVGFASFFAAAAWIERARWPEPAHELGLVQRIGAPRSESAPAVVFASSPEYQLLRGHSAVENQR